MFRSVVTYTPFGTQAEQTKEFPLVSAAITFAQDIVMFGGDADISTNDKDGATYLIPHTYIHIYYDKV